MSYIVNNIKDILELQKTLDYQLSMKGGAKNILNFKAELQKHNSYITTLFYISSLIIILIFIIALVKKSDFKMTGGSNIGYQIGEIGESAFNQFDRLGDNISDLIDDDKKDSITNGIATVINGISTGITIIPDMLWKASTQIRIIIYLIIIIIIILTYLFLNLLLDKKLYLPCSACDTGTEYYNCMPGTGKNSFSCKLYQDILRKLKKMIESFEYIGKVIEELTNSINRTINLICREIRKLLRIKISLPGISMGTIPDIEIPGIGTIPGLGSIKTPSLGNIPIGNIPSVNFGVIFDALTSFLQPIDIPDSWGFNLGQTLICVCEYCDKKSDKCCKNNNECCPEGLNCIYDKNGKLKCPEGLDCIYDKNGKLRSSHGSGFFKVFWGTLRIILQKEPFPNLDWPSFGGGSIIGKNNSNLSQNVSELDNSIRDKKRDEEHKKRQKELNMKMVEKRKEFTVAEINKVLKKIKDNNNEIKNVETKINKIINQTGTDIPITSYDWNTHPWWGITKKIDLIELLKINISNYSYKNTKHTFTASTDSGNYIDSYKQINIPIYRTDIDNKSAYELQIYIPNKKRISERLVSIFKQRYPFVNEILEIFRYYGSDIMNNLRYYINKGSINVQQVVDIVFIESGLLNLVNKAIGKQPEFQNSLNSIDNFIGGNNKNNILKIKGGLSGITKFNIRNIRNKLRNKYINEINKISTKFLNKLWDEYPQLKDYFNKLVEFDSKIDYLIEIIDYSYIRVVNPENYWIYAPGDTWEFNNMNNKNKNTLVDNLIIKQNNIKKDTKRLLKIYKTLNQEKSDIENENDKDAIYAGLLEALMKVEINPVKWIASLFNLIINNVNKLLQFGVVNPIKSILQLIIRLVNKIIDSIIAQLKKILNLIVMPIKKVSKLVTKIHINFYKAFQVIFEIGPINMILYYFYNKLKNIFSSFIAIISAVIVLVSFLIVCPMLGAIFQFFRIYNTSTNLIHSFINDILIFFAQEYIDKITIYKDKLMTFITENLQKFITFIMNITIGNPFENPQQLIYVIIAIVIIVGIIIFGLSIGNYNNNFVNDFISKNTNKMFNNIDKPNKLKKKDQENIDENK